MLSNIKGSYRSFRKGNAIEFCAENKQAFLNQKTLKWTSNRTMAVKKENKFDHEKHYVVNEIIMKHRDLPFVYLPITLTYTPSSRCGE